MSLAALSTPFKLNITKMSVETAGWLRLHVALPEFVTLARYTSVVALPTVD